MDLRLSKKVQFGDRYHQNVTGVSTTGYSISTTGSVTSSNRNTPCSTAAPCLSYNSSFGTVNNANSNFAYSPRQIQIGFRFFF